ncbi:OPT-2 protein, partial [Aphelenchoides avenae]
RQLIEDVKSLLRVLVMFLPVPIFWAIYDQQGSLWTIQALEMDCRLWGTDADAYLLLPDQMQTLNAVLILAFIPIFQVIVYPLVSFCINLTPLRKMIAGGVLAAVAMVITALVQFQVNKTLPDIPAKGHSFVSFVNGFEDCSMNVTWQGGNKPMHFIAQNS